NKPCLLEVLVVDQDLTFMIEPVKILGQFDQIPADNGRFIFMSGTEHFFREEIHCLYNSKLRWFMEFFRGKSGHRLWRNPGLTQNTTGPGMRILKIRTSLALKTQRFFP